MATIQRQERDVMVYGYLKGKAIRKDPKTGKYYVEFDEFPMSDGWYKPEFIKFIQQRNWLGVKSWPFFLGVNL